MTYNEDPTRWTSSPEDAPEALRGPFAAGREEGPSRAQMRSLAFKIAAASAGGAIAVGTVKAASAGQAVATAATWSVGKIATVVALAGTLVTGGAVVWNATRSDKEAAPAAGAKSGEVSSTSANDAPAALDQAARGGSNDAPTAKYGAPLATSAEPGSRPAEIVAANEPSPAAPKDVPAAVEEPKDVPAGDPQRVAPRAVASAELAESAQDSARAGAGSSRAARTSTGVRSASTEAAATSAPKARAGARPQQTARAASREKNAISTPTTLSVSAKAGGQPSELELLRRAQVALQARPREAFQLTQEHRRLYPGGEFAQERDALAIQALMRAGETEKARELAKLFIGAHPSSPHAHRFREAMGLQ